MILTSAVIQPMLPSVDQGSSLGTLKTSIYITDLKMLIHWYALKLSPIEVNMVNVKPEYSHRNH